MKKTTAFSILFSLAFVVFGYQNCSKKGFTTATSDNITATSDNISSTEVNGIQVSEENFNISSKPVADKVDVLFVVDESVSMNQILENVNKGFASIQSSKFPKNTNMAVTNMSPARLDDSGDIQASAAYFTIKKTQVGKIRDYPGFMRLVSGPTIDRFKTTPTAGFSHYDEKFQLSGCGSWFKPDQKHADGHPCLAAATQIAATGTGFEAGIVSLKQLLEIRLARGLKLFRQNALVNIIFISDTHDAGANYYGRDAHAYQVRDSYSQIKALIEDNHELHDLTFSAIAPVPWAGHPEGVGLNIIGSRSPDEATFDGTVNEHYDSTRSFSYMDFVRQSGGVALDPYLTDNWGPAIESLVKISSGEVPVVKLSQSVNRILSITINGDSLDLEKDKDSKYVLLSSDTMSFPGYADKSLNIQIRYEHN